MDNPDLLPIPKTKIGWSLSILIIALSFAIYYPFLFPCLETKYWDSYWSPVTIPETEQPVHYSGMIYIPRYLSSYSSSEMIITITNHGKDTINLELLFVSKYESKNKSGDQSEPIVIFSVDNDNEELTYKSGNHLGFLNIPPGASITQSVWIRQTGAKNGKVNYIIYVLMTNPDGQVVTDPEKLDIKDQYRFSIIDRVASLIQAITDALLLPPLSNVLIIFLALFSVYTVEKNDDENCNEANPPRSEWLKNISKWFYYTACKECESRSKIKRDFWEKFFLSFIRCMGTLGIIVAALVLYANSALHLWQKNLPSGSHNLSNWFGGVLLIVVIAFSIFLYRFPYSKKECQNPGDDNTHPNTPGQDTAA